MVMRWKIAKFLVKPLAKMRKLQEIIFSTKIHGYGNMALMLQKFAVKN